MPDPGFLRITTPDGQVKEYAIDFTSAIVGRADGNRIVIPHVSISRRHAHLTVENGELFVEDFASATGTFLGGVQLQPDERRAIAPGSELRFGDARAVYVVPQAAPPPPTSTPIVATTPPPVFSEPPPPPKPVETVYTAPPVNPGPPLPAPVPPHSTAIPFHLAQAMETPVTGDMSASAAMAAQSEASKRQFIGVTLASPAAPIAPGTAAAATVTLTNRGSIVDEFAVSIEGVPPEWVQIARPRISLLPGSKDELTVVFRPPADSTARAGAHPFTVVVLSRQHGIDVRAIGEFSVTAIERLETSIRPIRGAGPFTVTVVNTGNVAAPLRIEGTDDEEKLQFTIPPDTVVQPGETVTIPVQVRAQRGVKVEKESPTAFRLSVRSTQTGAPPTRLDGTAVLAPSKQRWKAPVAALAILGVLGIGAFGVASACSSDSGVCSSIKDRFSGDNAIAGDPTPGPTVPANATRSASVVALPTAPPTNARTVAPTQSATTPPTTAPTHTPTRAPTATPTKVTYNVTGRWQLADTVTFGRDTGQTYTFTVDFVERDDGLLVTGSGSGLKFDGYRQGDFVKLDFTRDNGDPGGFFEWRIQPDGRLVGTYEDYRTNNGGNSIATRQR